MAAARPLLRHDLKEVELFLVVQHAVARNREPVSTFLPAHVDRRNTSDQIRGETVETGWGGGRGEEWGGGTDASHSYQWSKYR